MGASLFFQTLFFLNLGFGPAHFNFLLLPLDGSYFSFCEKDLRW